MICEVELADLVHKQVRKLPGHVVVKLLGWVRAVRDQSLEEVRRVSGFHDEPVKGTTGLRSIRLSRAYRAYYRIQRRPRDAITVEFVRVESVDKHKYGK